MICAATREARAWHFVLELEEEAEHDRGDAHPGERSEQQHAPPEPVDEHARDRRDDDLDDARHESVRGSYTFVVKGGTPYVPCHH